MTNPLSFFTTVPTWGVFSAAIPTAYAGTPTAEPTQTADLTASTTTVDADVPPTMRRLMQTVVLVVALSQRSSLAARRQRCLRAM